jgi:O-antigen ligase
VSSTSTARSSGRATSHAAASDVRFLGALLIGGAFAIVLAGVQSPLFDLDRHAVPKELVLHCVAFAALLAMLPRMQRIEPGLVGALLAAFLLWSVLSTLFATNRWLAMRGVAITFSGVVVFAAAQRLAGAHATRRVLVGFAAAAALAALLGAAQAWGLEWTLLQGNRPPGGTFGNRNFLAHLLAIALPVTVYLTLTSRPGRALPGLVALLVLAGVIVLTRSRAAWVAVVLALVLATACGFVARHALTRAIRRTRLFMVGAALLCGALLAMVLPNRLEWRSEAPYTETFTGIVNYREGSGRGRLIQYGNTLRMLAERPITGTGPGNWFVQYPRFTTDGDPSFFADDPLPTNPWPSSDWVAFLAERGIIGVSLLGLAGLAALITALRRLDGEGDDALRAIALCATLVAAFTCGLFDAVLLLAPPTYFVFAALGLLLPSTRPVVSRPVKRRAQRILMVAMLGAAALAILANSAQLGAILLAGDGDDTDAVALAVRIDPGNHRLRLLLARRGRCTFREPHARAAAGLLPHHSAPRAALSACGG